MTYSFNTREMIQEKLQKEAQDVDKVKGNKPFKHLIGDGRLNIEKFLKKVVK